MEPPRPALCIEPYHGSSAAMSPDACGGPHQEQPDQKRKAKHTMGLERGAGVGRMRPVLSKGIVEVDCRRDLAAGRGPPEVGGSHAHPECLLLRTITPPCFCFPEREFTEATRTQETKIVAE